MKKLLLSFFMLGSISPLFCMEPSPEGIRPFQIISLRDETFTPRSVSLSPDGSALYVFNDESGTFKIYDTKTGRIKNTLDHDHFAEYKHFWPCDSLIKFSPDGRFFASVAANMIRLWNYEGECIGHIQGSIDILKGSIDILNPSLVIFSPDSSKLIFGRSMNHDRSIEVYDVATLRRCHGFTRVFDGGRVPVALFFGHDYKTLEVLLEGKTSNIIATLNVDTGAEISYLKQRRKKGTRIAEISPDGTKIISHKYKKRNRSIIIEIVSTSVLRANLEMWSADIHRKKMPVACFSQDSCYVAASDNKTIKIWDAQKGDLICTLKGHKSSVVQVIYSADGGTLASLSKDGTVNIWDMASILP